MNTQKNKYLHTTLIVDDKHGHAQDFNDTLKKNSRDTTADEVGNSAVELCSKKESGLSLANTKLPDTKSLEMIKKLTEQFKDLEFAIISDYRTKESSDENTEQRKIIACRL